MSDRLVNSPILLVVGLSAVWHLALWILGIPFNPYWSGFLFILDLVAVYLIRSYWIFFFAQFVLPVRTPEQRTEIYRRVKDHLSGERGPALFIRNGQVISGPGELEKRRRGVIWLDTASAGVLRTDTQLSGAVGPGIAFTQRGEYLAGSVDLRSQVQSAGPLRGDQPFAAPAPPGTPEVRLHEQFYKRRQETSGLTRDGFEVVPSLSVKFSIIKPAEITLDPQAGPGVNTQYGYDPQAVRNAISREGVHVGGTQDQERLTWRALPVHLVVNLWREYIRKFTLPDLFSMLGASGLQTIELMINKRLSEERYFILDDEGLPTQRQQKSPEFEQLQQRGVNVDEVRIHAVHLDPLLEEKIIQQWSNSWLENAIQERRQLEERASLSETFGREAAVKMLALTASRYLSAVRRPAGAFDALRLAFQPLKEAVVNEQNQHSGLESELRQVDDVWKWILEYYDKSSGPGTPKDRP